ncbi:radical SAM protein [Desulfovibrio sulfodismutans]|uniref:Radical SAM protein n=1 Tax=Desulfolutivibrio sulfodismutans TaxID=63561 RepID=A0A7K3NLR5_9BACT|nr:radical SAM protein [Desulfolutivibrio sulfodismutans]NDY56129.1 radical SAM protein [Desulfolutivibrio sulfodismutans]QLA13182.1 radical SAM protein [Desulfolutivibrio sulfodismutans DSM 3696]
MQHTHDPQAAPLPGWSTPDRDFPGVQAHPPGELSRGAVLDVGLKCPHSCAFCYYSYYDGGPGQFTGVRKASMRPTSECLDIVRAIAGNGLTHLDITGGEPTVHPGLPQIVAEAAAKGLAVRCITLGQYLMRVREGHRLLDTLLENGLTDILFSLHAADATAFQETCGGSLDAVLSAMDALDSRGFQYACNTVIMERNRRDLPRIARLAVSRGVYAINFIAFNAYHAWRGQEQAAALEAPYTKIRPFLEEAVAILDAGGVAVNIRYVPLCAFPALARHVVGVLGVAYDPFEWRNRCLNHDKPAAYCAEPLPIPDSGIRPVYAFTRLEATSLDGSALCGMRGAQFKLFPAQCAGCPARGACDGVDPVYLSRHGAGEFAPLQEAVQGPLLASRLRYGPPFLVKTRPTADMRGAMAACLAKSNSEVR